MQLGEHVQLPRASARIVQFRPRRDSEGNELPIRWLAPEVPDLESVEVINDEITHNVITTVGRDYLHLQGYGTTGLGTNGLNWIGLSNDTLTETSASTTLSTEIAANGLTRAQGTYTHTAGTNTTTISRTFTATATQAAQKAALFTAVSGGTMNHALAFTQRTLANGDSLAITFTITLG